MKVRHRTMLRPSLKTQCMKVLIAIEIAMLGVFGVVPASTIIGAFDIPLPTFAGMTPFTVPEARADIPTTLGYQGRLKNASGTALTGTYSFIFRVYASSTGGPLLWNETQSVVVDSGYFAVQLGSVTPFAMDMNQALYLTTEVSADGEMTPRVPINSVSFAYTAGGVNAFAAEPTSASGGRMYYNTATGNIYYFDAIASIWRQLTSTSTATNLSSLVFGNATGASLNLGNLNVTGTTNLMGLFTFVNGTGTSLSVTNLSTTNFTPTNITWANATGTNTTSTNLYASNANISNLLWNGATGTSLNVTQGTTLNTLSASGSSTLTTLNFTNATGTGLFATNIRGTTGAFTSSLTVGGTNVCLSDGTNCPGGGGIDDWNYSSLTNILSPVTSTASVALGGVTEGSPFFFRVQPTSSRLLLGANGSSTDVVIGGPTSTITNTAFQLDGNDLFVAGNIGSASSVYTNGAFIAGATTFYGDNNITFSATGTIRSTSQTIVLAPASGDVVPPSDLSVSLGRFDLRFNANLGNVTSTNATSTNFFATNLTATNFNVTNFDPTNLTWTNATGTNTTSTNFYASNLLWNGATGTNLLVTGTVSTSQLSVGGYSVCLSSGTNCPPSSAESDTLASVTQRGASATTTVTLYGGLVTSNLTVTNTASINAIDVVDRNATSVNIATTNLTVTGTANIAALAVSGLTTLQNFTFLSGTGTNLYVTNLSATGTTNLNLVTWNGATGTNLFVSNTLTAATGSFTNLNTSNFPGTNATGTNTTSTNLYASNANISNLLWNGATGTSLNVTQGTTLNTLSASGSSTLTTLNFTNATGTSLAVTSLLVGGTTVCLSNGSNCPSTAGGSDDWTYSASNDFVRPNTNTTSLVLGASTVANAPYWFRIDSTSSRAYFGAFGPSTNIVLGGPTSTITNTMFQLDGNDLYVAGNIGSASSVYTNGAFIAGASTLYGDGYVNKTDGNLVLTASGGFITPASDLAVSLGSAALRYNGIFGNTTSTNATSTNLFATNLTATNLNVGSFNPTNLIWVNATGTNTTSTNLAVANLYGVSNGYAFLQAAGGITDGLGYTNTTGANLHDGAGNIIASMEHLNVPSLGSISAFIVKPGPSDFGGVFALENASANDTVLLSSFNGIQLGSDAEDTAAGLAISVTSPSGTRFSVDGSTGNVVTTGTLLTRGNVTVNGTAILLENNDAENTTLTIKNATTVSAGAAGPLLTLENDVAIHKLFVMSGGNGGMPNSMFLQQRGTTGNLVLNSVAGNIIFMNGDLGGLNTLGTVSASGTWKLGTEVTSYGLAGSGDLIAKNVEVNGVLYADQGLSVAGTSTLQGVTWTNATGTNTTSTNLASTGLLTFNTATGVQLIANIGTFATATVMGQGICLSNGVNCPASVTTETDTLASVTQRGASATTTVTLFGGLVTSNLTVTGTTSLIDGVFRSVTGVNMALTNLIVTGTAVLQNTTFTNATGANLFVTNFNPTNLTWVNATGTNTTSTNLFVTNGTITNLRSTQVLVDNGSAASRSFAFKDNPSTGIYGHGLSTIRFSTAGTERLVISTSNITASLPFLPSSNNFYDLGSGAQSWANIYASGTIFVVGGQFTNVTSTNATTTNLNVTALAQLPTNTTIGGTTVCLSNGTNCPSSTAGSDDWTYSATNDFVRPNTNTTSLVLGASTVANAPYWFRIDSTSSRMYLGAFGSSTNIVLGGPTSTITNTMFQLDGNDLFVAGNIGSASSVYTNGAFIAGSGSTLYGDGYITKTNGSLNVTSSGIIALNPSMNGTVIIGTSTPATETNIVSGLEVWHATNSITGMIVGNSMDGTESTAEIQLHNSLGQAADIFATDQLYSSLPNATHTVGMI